MSVKSTAADWKCYLIQRKAEFGWINWGVEIGTVGKGGKCKEYESVCREVKIVSFEN